MSNSDNKYIKLVFIFISLLYTSIGLAQTFKSGAIIGLSGSQIDGDTQGGYKKMGALAGVYVKTEFSELAGAKIELNYIGKGAVKITNKVQEFKTHLNYIELPVLLTLEFLNNIEVDIGISAAYLISSKLTNYGYEISRNEYNLQDYDFSGLASFFYNFSDNFSLNTRVSYSILPISNSPGWFNSNICFALIYKFN